MLITLDDLRGFAASPWADRNDTRRRARRTAIASRT